jgi:hypothetical protein
LDFVVRFECGILVNSTLVVLWVIRCDGIAPAQDWEWINWQKTCTQWLFVEPFIARPQPPFLRKDWSKKEDGERENWKIQIIVAVGGP